MEIPKQKMQITIVAALSVIFIILLIGLIAGPKKRSRRPARKTAVPAAGPAAAAIPVALMENAPVEKDERPWGRDPFEAVKSDVGARTSGNLVLHGILFDEERPSAIINGMVVTVGDKIAGCKVIQIERSSVTLDGGAEQHKLKLWE